MRYIYLLLVLLLSTGSSFSQSSIIMSTIGHQEVYEGARITVYFSTLKHFESIDLSSADIPSFGTLYNDGNGDGRFVFDASHDDIGAYTVSLSAVSDDLFTESCFTLVVKEIPSDATFLYVDPVNGGVDNPGTADEPLLTLTNVFINNLEEVKANTFIFLRSGFHGSPVFQGSYETPVYVLAEKNHTPTMKKLSFSFTTNWYVSGLDVSPENNNQSDNATLVSVFAGSKDITLTNCKIYCIEDASVWETNEDWYAGSGNGIVSSGQHCLYKNNYLKNTWFSIEMKKAHNEFSYNIINWFGADAVRALANHQRIQYNQIKNATVFDYDHPTQPQHDDGIQSWTFNLPVKDMIIRGNQIVDIADPNLPLPTEIMQGIVDFDGFAEDWVVENNLVITHHAHGIALYGAENCKVVNNTVIRNPLNYFSPNFKPWIRINPRKVDVGGDLSTGNLVRNNIMAIYQDDGKEPGSEDHNTVGTNYSSFFEDYEGWNFYLSESSSAVNTGDFEDAPFIDLERKRRTVEEVDAGCFERGAILTDKITPTIPFNIMVTDVTQTSISVEWNPSMDANGVAFYEIELNGENPIISEDSQVLLTDLTPSTEYTIGVQAVDFFGNRSDNGEVVEWTKDLDMVSVYFSKPHKHDQVVKSNSKLMWVGMPYLRVGGYYGQYNASSVLPFKLPCLDGRKVVTADLVMNLDEIIGNPSGNVDLYAIASRSISDVKNGDYFDGDYDTDDDGIALMEDYMTNETPLGKVSVDESGQEKMGAFIQGELDDGVGCQDYFFLRINDGIDNEANFEYFKINSADHKNSLKVPLLKMITSGTDGVIPVKVNGGVLVSPNPSSGKDILIELNGFGGEKTTLVIHDASGKKVFSMKLEGNRKHVNINKEFDNGMYFVTLLGRNMYAESKLIIID